VDEDFIRDLETVEQHHPILRRFENERDRILLEIEQARNRTLPSLDLRVELSRDFGDANAGIDEQGKLSSASRSETEVKALMSLRMPVQQRRARGRLAAARLRLSRLTNEARIAEERIIASALEAIEQLKAAYEQTGLARENVELARMLRDAESRRLTLGLSNLIDVNIREVQAATAETELVNAQRAFFRATAEYQARVASMP
jgi:outer membrane protein TolC